MKFRLWSDVHLEFGELNIQRSPEDKDTVLVIAGDFTVGADDNTRLIMLNLCNMFKAVVYTCGNHEYYGNVIEEIDAFWRDFSYEVDNFYFLQGDYVVVDGTRFVGGTFWTDMRNHDTVILKFIETRMNDFGYIKCIDQKTKELRAFTPKDAADINKKQRKIFKDILSEEFDGQTIVVTHHAPLDICVHPRYTIHAEDRMMNYGYKNTGIEEWFWDDTLHFDGWLHGHIHYRQKHVVNNRVVLSNPRGYVEHEPMADTFRDDLIFTI